MQDGGKIQQARHQSIRSTMRTRIKFCGITRVDDAVAAAELGVDAIGLIFAPASVRRLDVLQAREIADATSVLVTRVALFMNQSADQVARVLDVVKVELLQFHGREDDVFCTQFGKPYLKAVPMLDVDDVAQFAAGYPGAAGFVLDAHRTGEAGGTGASFDWSRASGALRRPMVLAGGLHHGNVGAAVVQVRPWAVDTSSGIESSPGIKDRARMAAFIDEVRRVGG